MSDAARVFAALSQESRLGVVRLLLEHGPNGVPAGELAGRLAMPASTASFHLSALERCRPRFGDPAGTAGPLCRADRRPARASVLSYRNMLRRPPGTVRRSLDSVTTPPEGARSDGARLQRAVSLHPQLGPLDRRRGDREPLCRRALPCLFRRFGPAEAPMPEVIAKLRALGHDVSGLHSKSWQLFTGPEAPRLDFVIALCDTFDGQSLSRISAIRP